MEPLTTALLVGGGAKLGSAILGAFGSANAGREQRRAINRATGEINKGYDQAMGYNQPLLDIGMGGLEDWSALAGQGVEDPRGFTYDKNVMDFLSPAMQYEQQSALNALQGSALAQGTLNSGATQKKALELLSNIGRQGYGQAQQAMQQDRAFNAQNFWNDFEARKQARQQRFAELGQIAGVGINASQNAGNLATQRAGALANAQMQKGVVNSQMAMLPYQVGGQILSGAGENLASYFGTQANQDYLSQLLGGR
jgi:hypothetical protein